MQSSDTDHKEYGKYRSDKTKALNDIMIDSIKGNYAKANIKDQRN